MTRKDSEEQAAEHVENAADELEKAKEKTDNKIHESHLDNMQEKTKEKAEAMKDHAQDK